MHKLTSAPKFCLSPIDSEIQIKCDHLLKTDMFKSLLESKGFFPNVEWKKIDQLCFRKKLKKIYDAFKAMQIS
jgi:hypothetical protein